MDALSSCREGEHDLTLSLSVLEMLLLRLPLASKLPEGPSLGEPKALKRGFVILVNEALDLVGVVVDCCSSEGDDSG